MPHRDDIARWRANWQDEVDSAHLYGVIADLESHEALREIWRKLSASEAKHARFWEERMRAAGVMPPARRVTWRTRWLEWLARRLGPQFVLPTLVARERDAGQEYAVEPAARGTDMAASERSHARLLRTMAGTTRGAGMSGSALAQVEGRHHAVGGNALRAAVLGANDGLVSNLSLVMGVAGATIATDSNAVLIAGLAGLMAGASSMAMGEWLSVQSSRELYERQIATEAQELEEAPEEELHELVLIYQAKGLSEENARTLANGLMADREKALDTLAREELGIDPTELGGSAWEAAAASFILFVFGAAFPVAPFLFAGGPPAVVASLIVSGLALFGIGAVITLLTGRSIWYSGTRQFLIGLGAAGLTFAIGRLIGVAILG